MACACALACVIMINTHSIRGLEFDLAHKFTRSSTFPMHLCSLCGHDLCLPDVVRAFTCPRAMTCGAITSMPHATASLVGLQPWLRHALTHTHFLHAHIFFFFCSAARPMASLGRCPTHDRHTHKGHDGYHFHGVRHRGTAHRHVCIDGNSPADKLQ